MLNHISLELWRCKSTEMDIRSSPCVIYLFVLPTDTHRNRIIIYSRRSPSGTFSVVVSGNKPIYGFNEGMSSMAIAHLRFQNHYWQVATCLSCTLLWVDAYYFETNIKYIYFKCLLCLVNILTDISVSYFSKFCNANGSIFSDCLRSCPQFMYKTAFWWEAWSTVRSDPVLLIGKVETSWSYTVKGDKVWGGASPIASCDNFQMLSCDKDPTQLLWRHTNKFYLPHEGAVKSIAHREWTTSQ